MGFFSWRTADTHKSIMNTYAETPHTSTGPIYLLRPGEPPIKEAGYSGNGDFGNVDAYSWLAIKNLESEINSRFAEELGNESQEAIEYYKCLLVGDAAFSHNGQTIDIVDMESMLPLNQQGFGESLGFIARDIAINTFVSPQKYDPDGVRVINGKDGIPFSYQDRIPQYDNKTLNELRSEGFFIEKMIIPEFPLKFSFDKDAIYENLSASEDCPLQGYFSGSFDLDETPGPR